MPNLSTRLGASTIALAALAATTTLAAPSAVADVNGSKAQQGVSIQTDPSNPLWTQQTARLYDDIVTVGANTLVITFPLEQDTNQSTTIHTRPKSSVARAYTPSDQELITTIHRARERGLKVVIKPHLEARNGGAGGWRSHIQFTNAQDKEADAQAAAWRAWLVHYAKLGQKEGAYGIVLGTEQFGMTLDRYNDGNTARWVKTSKAVEKAAPKLKRSYAAYKGSKTWPDEGMEISPKFTKTLNGGLGITFYPRADPKDKTLSVKTLRKAYGERWGANFKAMAKKHGQKITVEETGFKGPDFELQARQTEALMDFLDDSKAVDGVFYYRWLNDPAAGGAHDTNFTTTNRPGQKVLAKWFGGSVPR